MNIAMIGKHVASAVATVLTLSGIVTAQQRPPYPSLNPKYFFSCFGGRFGHLFVFYSP